MDADLEFITSLTDNLYIFNEGKRIVVDYYSPGDLSQQRMEGRYLTEVLNLKALETILTLNETTSGLGKAILKDMTTASLASSYFLLYSCPT